MTPSNKSLLTLCAADLMSTGVVMVPREMSLQGAARMLARANVSGAPVVDMDGRCIGVLSATDFMHWVEHGPTEDAGPSETLYRAWQIPEEHAGPSCRVEDFMTRDPVLVSPGTRVTDVARMMRDAHIHRVIVVDLSDKPIGIVSSMDILAAVACADPGHVRPEKDEPALANDSMY